MAKTSVKNFKNHFSNSEFQKKFHNQNKKDGKTIQFQLFEKTTGLTIRNLAVEPNPNLIPLEVLLFEKRTEQDLNILLFKSK